MSRRARLLGALIFLILTVVLIVIGQVAYDFSSLVSRIVLITTFLVITAALLWNAASARSDMKWAIFLTLVLASLFFSLYRSSFDSPFYVVETLNSETYVVAKQYAMEGRLTFGSPHSYFFSFPLISSIMTSVCGLSFSQVIFVWPLVYAFFVVLIGYLMLRATMEQLRNNIRSSKMAFILPSLIALFVVSFSYSERRHLFLALTM